MGCVPGKENKETTYRIQAPEIHDPQIELEGSAPFAKHFLASTMTRSLFKDSTAENTNSQKEDKMEMQETPSNISIDDPEVQKTKELKQKYQQCMYFYEHHQIDRANEFAQILLMRLRQTSLQDKLSMQRQLLKIINQNRKVKQFHSEVIKTGWQFKGEDKGIKVSSRREKDTVAVLIEAEINIPVQILAAVLTEVDLFYKFVPFMESSKELKVCARNAKIGHCINNLPLISKRQAFFFGIGYDRLQHNGSIFIYTESLLQSQDLMKQHNYFPKPTEGAVQLDYKYLIFEYSPKDSKSGHVRLAINVDMKLPYVPMFIMDLATRDFGFDFFKNMIKISKNFNQSQWKQKVTLRPDLFNFFKDRVQDYVSKK